ncbi:hypothetical protein FZC79_18485 [Rossellomorea vietnamensis]|uniref:Uncharacterized protein n=1 Tax=Rossellomorea vietnamensis TaxID=218284 RepID=A0A5D4K863_9BACI|nr:hypothetical protein [Rossellomorea vietnamensis]TYR73432.1 hypothetical protein FZC79_18485 [Rossellomorea vietnamensis]
MKKFIKEFLLSSAFVWVLYFFLLITSGFTVGLGESEGFLPVFGIFLPLLFLIFVVLPGVYISIILRNEKNKWGKGFLYFCLSWLLFWGLLQMTGPVITRVQNHIIFGGQGEEQKQALISKAEVSLEEKQNRQFKLVNADYENDISFHGVAFRLNFIETNCEDCRVEAVYLSHEDNGWRMKIINGEIWYLEEEQK